MTLHQHLPIYKLAVDLLDLAVDLTRNMPRDFKGLAGRGDPQRADPAHRADRQGQRGLQLNPRKTILQPVDRGVDFVGHVIKPWRRTTRRGTVERALRAIEHCPAAELATAANSYFGLLRQASSSHADRARLANAVRKRGRSVAGTLTKTYLTASEKRHG